MVSIIEQEKMLLAFARENRLSHDSEVCPSNLSSSTAGSSTDTNISADDLAALQAATAAKAMSASDDIVGSGGEIESDNDDGTSYFQSQQASSSSLIHQQHQPLPFNSTHPSKQSG